MCLSIAYTSLLLLLVFVPAFTLRMSFAATTSRTRRRRWTIQFWAAMKGRDDLILRFHTRVVAGIDSCPKSVGSDTTTLPGDVVCPKCGITKKSGKRSCCARGGAWFRNCGDAGDAKFEHTWAEGAHACKRRFCRRRVLPCVSHGCRVMGPIAHLVHRVGII